MEEPIRQLRFGWLLGQSKALELGRRPGLGWRLIEGRVRDVLGNNNIVIWLPINSKDG